MRLVSPVISPCRGRGGELLTAGVKRSGWASPPLATHVLVVVQPGRDGVVRLTGFDLDGDKLRRVRV